MAAQSPLYRKIGFLLARWDEMIKRIESLERRVIELENYNESQVDYWYEMTERE